MFAGKISIGHFGCFTTDQRDPRFFARFYHSGYNFFYNFGFQFIVCNIVEKSKGSRTHDQNIVGGCAQKINADGIEFSQFSGDYCFGPHTINALDHNGMIIFFQSRFQIVERTETPEPRKHIGRKS